MATLILDNFIDANDTDLSAHTISPTNTPAASWLIGGGAFKIQSNRAVAFPSGGVLDYVDAGVSDGTITSTINLITSGDEAGLLFRVADASNFWFVSGYAGDGKSYLYFVFEGSPANVASGGSGITSGVDFTLTVVLSGPNITVSINGVFAYTYYDIFGLFPTETKHGLANNTANANQWDDFQIDSAAAPTGSLFRVANLSGLQAGGPFFVNPLG